jgi:hypothetical protein
MADQKIAVTITAKDNASKKIDAVSKRRATGASGRRAGSGSRQA